MNILDIIIISVMVFLIIRGIMRGFIKEIASLAGIILGILLAIYFLPQMTEYLKKYIPNFQFLPLISFAVIFISVLILCNLMGWAIKMLFKKVFLGWLDRTLGAGLAILKGIIITYLVIVLLTVYVPPSAPIIARSKLAPLITASFLHMKRFISNVQYQKLKKKFLEKRKEETKTGPKKTGEKAK